MQKGYSKKTVCLGNPRPLFKTAQINATNRLKALNEQFLTDHKSIQTLQKELAKRDEKLLGEIQKLSQETHPNFSELNETMNQGFQEVLSQFDAKNQKTRKNQENKSC